MRETSLGTSTSVDVIDQLVPKLRRARLYLRPPALESLVAQFETDAGIRLPEDYRDFLLRIADGGIEPCRLVPLSCWDSCYWIDDSRPSLAAAESVVTPDAWEHGAEWLDRTNVDDWEGRWDVTNGRR